MPNWLRATLGYLVLAAVAYVPVLRSRPGQGRGRHQAVPVPRPGSPARARRLDVGPEHRRWAPSPTRTSATCSRWVPTTGCANGSACPTGSRNACGWARLLFAAGCGMLYLLRTFGLRGPGIVVAAFAYMLTPYSLDYSARISVLLMPWAALPVDGRTRPQGVARRRLAVSGALRDRRPGRRRRERDRVVVRRPRSRAVGRVLVARCSRRAVAARRWCHGEDRRADDRHVLVVDRGTLDPRWLRPERAALHRDGRGGRAHVDTQRDPARPRLLVLLRPGPAGPVDRSGRELHAASCRHPRRLRARRARRCCPPASCAGGTARSSSASCSSES